VHVPRGVEWINLLDDREGAARALGGSLDQDLRPADRRRSPSCASSP
jgi:hypothetical protein